MAFVFFFLILIFKIIRIYLSDFSKLILEMFLFRVPEAFTLCSVILGVCELMEASGLLLEGIGSKRQSCRRAPGYS